MPADPADQQRERHERDDRHADPRENAISADLLRTKPDRLRIRGVARDEPEVTGRECVPGRRK
jgi:hypothetical protein